MLFGSQTNKRSSYSISEYNITIATHNYILLQMELLACIVNVMSVFLTRNPVHLVGIKCQMSRKREKSDI